MQAQLASVHQLPRIEPPVNWNFDAVGQQYAVTVGRELFAPTAEYDHPSQEAVIVRRAENTVAFRYDPPTIDRYVDRVFFYRSYVVLLVAAVGAGDLDVPPPVWAIRIDPRTGTQRNLTQDLGATVTGFPSDITVTGRQVVAATPNATSKGMQPRECFTSIDIVTGQHRRVGCSPEGTVVSFVDPVPGGVSYLVSPLGQDLSACRHRFVIDVSTGLNIELDDGHNCRVWDGTVLAGWAIWSSPTAKDNAAVFLERSTVYARGPEGKIYQLGVSQSSHMFVCGSDVYFVTQAPSVKKKTSHKKLDSIFDTLTALQRWRPGSTVVETVYLIDGYDQRFFAAPSCTDNIVTVGYYGATDRGQRTYLQTDWFPARA
jgi:hypothetical protein